MTLAEISQELRLLAGELRGHDDLDQWIRLDALADEVDKERRFLTNRCNELARRVVQVVELEARLREVEQLARQIASTALVDPQELTA